MESTAQVREEIARVVPFYEGIQHLKKKGDQFQYGGDHLCKDWVFGTEDGKAHFSVLDSSPQEIPEGWFILSTRRGKQFNSMVQENRDAITGATRNAVLMNAEDAKALSLDAGESVRLINDNGQYDAQVFVASITRRHLQVHWPEGNALLNRSCRSPQAGVPDYNALVRIEQPTV
jgi:anaerobic selenocysteine-containing dehydrogenase